MRTRCSARGVIDVSRRASLVAQGAAEWRDSASLVRRAARTALAAERVAWSPQVVEAALDDVLWDLDASRAAALVRDREPLDRRPVLVILPGNVIGPTIVSAYCAALAGARVILKSPGVERSLAPILAEQFERLGDPLDQLIEARYWLSAERSAFAQTLEGVRRIVAFGSDETVAALRAEAGAIPVRGYGTSYSLGYVAPGADAALAAAGAARDICMFDQRGCMSPQTIYVEGDEAHAIAFAHALAAALRTAGTAFPRATFEPGEAAAVMERVRRFSMTALAPATHALETLILGPPADGAPDFVVVAQPFGPPARECFGRIVAVKPCSSIAQFVATVREEASLQYDTVGVAGSLDMAQEASLHRIALRVCSLGQMQRPPFGYRPRIEDFA